MNGWVWLAPSPIAAFIIWMGWWLWSSWRSDLRAAKAATEMAGRYRIDRPAASPGTRARSCRGRHHLGVPRRAEHCVRRRVAS